MLKKKYIGGDHHYYFKLLQGNLFCENELRGFLAKEQPQSEMNMVYVLQIQKS